MLTANSFSHVKRGKVLKEMQEQDASPYGLTDEQVAEVERRRADPNRKFVTIAEVLERFDRRRS